MHCERGGAVKERGLTWLGVLGREDVAIVMEKIDGE